MNEKEGENYNRVESEDWVQRNSHRCGDLRSKHQESTECSALECCVRWKRGDATFSLSSRSVVALMRHEGDRSALERVRALGPVGSIWLRHKFWACIQMTQIGSLLLGLSLCRPKMKPMFFNIWTWLHFGWPISFANYMQPEFYGLDPWGPIPILKK